MVTSWKKHDTKEHEFKYFSLLHSTYTMPDGRKKVFELVKAGNFCTVFPLTKDNQVVLVRQYRPGPEKMMLDLPAGGISAGERAEDAAERELLEETGYRGRMSFLAKNPLLAYSTQWKYIYLAQDCEKVQEQTLDEDEFIEVKLVSLAEFRTLIRSGEFTDADAGYIALDHLGLL